MLTTEYMHGQNANLNCESKIEQYLTTMKKLDEILTNFTCN